MTKFSALTAYESTHQAVVDTRVISVVRRQLKIVDALLAEARTDYPSPGRMQRIVALLDAGRISYNDWVRVFGNKEGYFD